MNDAPGRIGYAYARFRGEPIGFPDSRDMDCFVEARKPV